MNSKEEKSSLSTNYGIAMEGLPDPPQGTREVALFDCPSPDKLGREGKRATVPLVRPDEKLCEEQQKGLEQGRAVLSRTVRFTSC